MALIAMSGTSLSFLAFAVAAFLLPLVVVAGAGADASPILVLWLVAGVLVRVAFYQQPGRERRDRDAVTDLRAASWRFRDADAGGNVTVRVGVCEVTVPLRRIRGRWTPTVTRVYALPGQTVRIPVPLTRARAARLAETCR